MSHDLFYVSATRAREGLTVITSDSFSLQESIGVSGDRQSATELSRRSAAIKANGDMDDYRLHELYRQRQTHRHETKQEITQHVSIKPDPGISIGF